MRSYLQLQALHQSPSDVRGTPDPLFSIGDEPRSAGGKDEEQACGLHFSDGQDLSGELEELHARVTGVKDEHAVEAGELSALAVEASNAVVDLGMLPIQDVPQLPKSAQEVLKVVSLILDRW
jgi:hypothetical protein